ncbi:hypothetical protein Pmani_031927 [Petrolisthes manimaculis]|uniref:Uncharacterized protein n=1 Tax=Petrolisthes manimaculis TaxID=1843537 RepID=A0AAE1NUQ6_9EUCA|nr:hypothetical protein Pmani_031927 [Petrolisthes manimaculis]
MRGGTGSQHKRDGRNGGMNDKEKKKTQEGWKEWGKDRQTQRRKRRVAWFVPSPQRSPVANLPGIHWSRAPRCPLAFPRDRPHQLY